MRRAARIVAVLAAASIAACFTKPSAPHAGDGGVTDRDARRDGQGTNTMGDAAGDSQTASCTKDDFNDTATMNCESWGTATLSTFATITRANQTLKFAFSAMSTSASGSCKTKAPISITNGTSIHVLQFGNGLTSFSLTLDGSLVSTFNVNFSGSMYSWNLSCPGANVNNPSMSAVPPATWWQFKVTSPNIGVARVAIELSQTGSASSWSEFQSCTFNAANLFTGDVTMAGSGSGTSSVEFDDFNVKNCP
jgi:hypothetical protein